MTVTDWHRLCVSLALYG